MIYLLLLIPILLYFVGMSAIRRRLQAYCDFHNPVKVKWESWHGDRAVYWTESAAGGVIKVRGGPRHFYHEEIGEIIPCRHLFSYTLTLRKQHEDPQVPESKLSEDV